MTIQQKHALLVYFHLIYCAFLIEYIIYDDACHLKKYACNPIRTSETDTTKHIAHCHIVVDRFHFPGHVDVWCKEHCNPNKLEELNQVDK